METEKLIKFSLIIIMMFLIFLGDWIVLKFLKENKIKKVGNILEDNLKNKKKESYLSYERVEKYLLKNGSPFKLTPVTFFIAKIVLAAFGVLIGNKLNNLIILIGFTIFMFFILDIAIYLSNKKDNEKITLDLSEIYDCLRIQNKGGVFIQASLQECFLIAKNKRLKKALKELNNQIFTTRDIPTSLNDFNKKFNNSFIDTFVMTILQSMETGKSDKALEDVSEAIKETTTIIEKRQAGADQRKIDFIKIGIFLFLSFTILYAMFTEFSRQVLNLFN